MTNQPATTKEALEPPDRIYLPADTSADTWNILAKNPTHDWSTGEPANNIEYRRVSATGVAPVVDESHLDRIQKALDDASEERYQSLREWEQLSNKWKSEGDMYGWNFHQGMMAGANYVDIYYHRVAREIKTIREPAPASTVAPVEQSEYITATVQAGPIIDTRVATDEIVEWIGSVFPPALSGPYSKEGRRFKVESILERHFIAPASPAALRDEAEDFARRVVGTVFDNTAASHETLKQTMIERIADSITPHLHELKQPPNRSTSLVSTT